MYFNFGRRSIDDDLTSLVLMVFPYTLIREGKPILNELPIATKEHPGAGQNFVQVNKKPLFSSRTSKIYKGVIEDSNSSIPCAIKVMPTGQLKETLATPMDAQKYVYHKTTLATNEVLMGGIMKELFAYGNLGHISIPISYYIDYAKQLNTKHNLSIVGLTPFYKDFLLNGEVPYLPGEMTTDRIGFQVIATTCALRSMCISHNDLKPQNIAIIDTNEEEFSVGKNVVTPLHTHLSYKLGRDTYILESGPFPKIIDFDVSAIYSRGLCVQNEGIDQVVDVNESRQLHPDFRPGYDFVTFIYHFIQTYLSLLHEKVKTEELRDVILSHAKEMVATLMYMYSTRTLNNIDSDTDIINNDGINDNIDSLSKVNTIEELMRHCEKKGLKRKKDNACPQTLYQLEPRTFVKVFYKRLKIQPMESHCTAIIINM